MRRVGEGLLVAGAGLLIGLYASELWVYDLPGPVFWQVYALVLLLLTGGLVVELIVALRWGLRRVGKAWR